MNEAYEFRPEWKDRFNKANVGFTYDQIDRIFFLNYEMLRNSYADYGFKSTGKYIREDMSTVIYTNDYEVAFVDSNKIYAHEALSGDSVTNGLFEGCTDLKFIDYANFDTSNMTDMSYMFKDCTSLRGSANEVLDDRVFNFSFNTSNVRSMYKMFYGCSKLNPVKFDCDTSDVNDMSYMFYGCSSLTSIDFGSKFNTSYVDTMKYMFFGCSALDSLNLSKFNTSGVSSMSGMFEGCWALTSLDLSSFTIRASADVSRMLAFNNSKGIIRYLKTPKSVGTSISIVNSISLYDTSTGTRKTSIATTDANKIFSVLVDLTLDGSGGQWSDGSTQKHIYFFYNVNSFYSDNSCTTQITAVERPTKKGYDFDGTKGFYIKSKVNNANAGEKYVAYTKEFASDLCTDLWSNATLVCEWTLAQYDLILDPNGGVFASVGSDWSTSGSNLSRTEYYQTSISDLPTPTKTGYTFGGWQRRQKITVANNFDISNGGYTLTSSGVDADTYFVVGISNDANEHIYTVTFNADVEDNAWRFYWNDDSTPYYTVRKGFNTFTFSWEGERSSFTWDDVDDRQRSKILKISNLTFELASSSVTSIVLEEDTTLMAEWDPITYKVTLDANGGKWSDGSTQKEVYFKYRENKYYSDSACTQEITSIEKPTKANADYDLSKGFFTQVAKYGMTAGESYVGFTGKEFSEQLCDDIWGNDVTLICQYIDWPTTTFNANYVPYDEMVGSVSINGGIASGFSNSNYLKIKSRDSYGVSYFAYSDWELQIKATKATKKSTENESGAHYFFQASGTGWSIWSLMIGAGTANDFAVWYETETKYNNGEGWASFSFGAPSTKSEFTWLRLKYSGGVLTMLRSEDGKEFTTVRAVTMEAPYIDPSSQYMTFGNAWGDNYYGDTKIDFGETYLKAGGKIVWGNEATRITVRNGDAYGALPTVTRKGYIFRNWDGNLATDASKTVTANNTDYSFVSYTLNKDFVPGKTYSLVAKIKCELKNSSYTRGFGVYLDGGWYNLNDYYPANDDWGYYRLTFTAPFTRKCGDGSWLYSHTKNMIHFYNIPNSDKQYKAFSVDGFAIFEGEVGGEISGYGGYEKLLAGNSGYTCQATKDTTFYANWEKQKYSAYWDLNYDSGSSDPKNQESLTSSSKLKYNSALSRSSVTISASDSNWNYVNLGSLLPGYDYEITIGKYVFNSKGSNQTDDSYSILAYDYDNSLSTVLENIVGHANVENFTYKFYCPMTASRKSASEMGTCLLIYAGRSGATAGNDVTITNITVKCEERMQFSYNPELSREQIDMTATTSDNFRHTYLGKIMPGQYYQIKIGEATGTNSSGESLSQFSIILYDFKTYNGSEKGTLSWIYGTFGLKNQVYTLYCPNEGNYQPDGNYNGVSLLIYAGKAGETAGNSVSFTDVDVWQTSKDVYLDENVGAKENLYAKNGFAEFMTYSLGYIEYGEDGMISAYVDNTSSNTIWPRFSSIPYAGIREGRVYTYVVKVTHWGGGSALTLHLGDSNNEDGNAQLTHAEINITGVGVYKVLATGTTYHSYEYMSRDLFTLPAGQKLDAIFSVSLFEGDISVDSSFENDTPYNNGAISTLPEATRPDYDFSGWRTNLIKYPHKVYDAGADDSGVAYGTGDGGSKYSNWHLFDFKTRDGLDLVDGRQYKFAFDIKYDKSRLDSNAPEYAQWYYTYMFINTKTIPTLRTETGYKAGKQYFPDDKLEDSAVITTSWTRYYAVFTYHSDYDNSVYKYDMFHIYPWFGDFASYSTRSQQFPFIATNFELVDLSNDALLTSTSKVVETRDQEMRAQWTPQAVTVNVKIMSNLTNKKYAEDTTALKSMKVKYMNVSSGYPRIEDVSRTDGTAFALYAKKGQNIRFSDIVAKDTDANGKGLTFIGITTTGEVPKVDGQIVVQKEFTASSNTTYYIWFSALSGNKMSYDEDEGYFYYTDGWILQSYVGAEMNQTLNNYYTADMLKSLDKTFSFYKGGNKVEIKPYQYTDGNIYGAVVASESRSGGALQLPAHQIKISVANNYESTISTTDGGYTYSMTSNDNSASGNTYSGAYVQLHDSVNNTYSMAPVTVSGRNKSFTFTKTSNIGDVYIKFNGNNNDSSLYFGGLQNGQKYRISFTDCCDFDSSTLGYIPSRISSGTLTNIRIEEVYDGTYWFKYEPIRWRVSDYGVGADWSGWKLGETRDNYSVVSDRIVWASQMTTGQYDLGAGTNYGNTIVGGKNIDSTYEKDYNYSVAEDGSTKSLNRFNDASSDSVSRNEVEENEVGSGIRLASTKDIGLSIGDTSTKRARPTDFVAFILGKGLSGDDAGYSQYFVRDFGSKYYNLTVITAGGARKDGWSNRFMGYRLAMTMTEGSRWPQT